MDPVVLCPFNRNHRVPKSRFQHHIIKCMVNYPNYVQCLHNSLHWFKTREEMMEHLKTCPSQTILQEENQSGINVINNNQFESRKFHLSEENWDEEYP